MKRNDTNRTKQGFCMVMDGKTRWAVTFYTVDVILPLSIRIWPTSLP